MHSFTCLTAALAISGVALASPILNRRQTFSVDQVERSKIIKNGPAEVAKTLRKYGMPVSDSLIAACESQVISVGPGANGSAPAVSVDAYDSLYLTPVTIGNTTVQLDLDTGSADLWVYSSLQVQGQLEGHDYYEADPSKQIDGLSWKILYGDGSGAGGRVYADKVVVGGVTATSQAVEAATSVSEQFLQDTYTDGLLGLSMSNLSTVRPEPQKTWFETISEQLAEPLFAVNLKYHAPGSYDFGFIDESKYVGDINYVEADVSRGWWGVKPTAYSIGNETTAYATSAILDTGTTLMYIADPIAEAYYAKVEGAKFEPASGGYVFPCNGTLPDFGVTIGDVDQVVPGKHINYAPDFVDPNMCFGGIQSNSDMNGLSVYGDIFLKSKYVVHEMGATTRLGFAKQASM